MVDQFVYDSRGSHIIIYDRLVLPTYHTMVYVMNELQLLLLYIKQIYT